MAVPPLSKVGAVGDVAGAVEPSSVQPAVVAEEEAPAMSQPTVASQERNTLKGMARAASPEI